MPTISKVVLVDEPGSGRSYQASESGSLLVFDFYGDKYTLGQDLFKTAKVRRRYSQITVVGRNRTRVEDLRQAAFLRPCDLSAIVSSDEHRRDSNENRNENKKGTKKGISSALFL